MVIRWIVRLRGNWKESMEYLVGVGLALGVCVVFGRIVGFDRERVFYSMMLTVVATYYILFAAMGGGGRALALECVAAVAFSVAAVAGFKGNPWVLAIGLAGHGVFDFFHPLLIENAGVPVFWRGFCLSYDVVAGVFMAGLLMRSSVGQARAGKSAAASA